MDYTRNVESSPTADVNNFANQFMDYLISKDVTLSTADRRAISQNFRTLFKKQNESLYEMSMEQLVSELNGKVQVVTSYAEQLNNTDFLNASEEPSPNPETSDEAPTTVASSEPEQATTPKKQSSESRQESSSKTDVSQKAAGEKKKQQKESNALSQADSILSIQSMIDLPRAGLLSQEMKQKKEGLLRKRDWTSRTMTLRATDIAIMKSLVDMTAEMRRAGKEPVLYDTRLGSYDALIHVMLLAFLEKLQTDDETDYLECVYQAVEQEKQRRAAIDLEVQKLS